jgi:hypothetical protein
MAEPRPEDIERNVRSLTALFVQMGGGLMPWREHAIRDFIRHVSESMAINKAMIRERDELIRDMVREQRDSARPVTVASAEAATCAQRAMCPDCGRYVEQHDAPTHDTRTLCDGTMVALPVTWVTRGWAAAELGRDVSTLRNYEIEDALAALLGGEWVVAGLCPRNGRYCASEGRMGP